MKITKDNYIKATAEAMSRESTVKLFESDPNTSDAFTLFAYIVFTKIDGKDITEDDFDDAIADTIVGALPDKITNSTMLKDLALIIFSKMIWTELEKLEKPQQDDPKYDHFKSVLKSKID